MAVPVQSWGWSCAHCGVAWKGELRDPCPDCGRFGKRTIYETDVLDECESCGAAYFGVVGCPRCKRLQAEKAGDALMARFDLEWERLFDSLPGFVGWLAARERAKVLAQEQRIAVLAVSERERV